NHSAMQIALLQKYVSQPIIVNQLELNLLHNHLIDDGVMVNQNEASYAATDGLLDYCRVHDITIQAWSPIAGGQLFSPADDAPDNVKETARLIAELAEKYATTPEAIGFAWLLRHPAGIQPVMGSTVPQRIADSCRADDVTLSREEWYRLFIAARGGPLP
ncbi:MAG: aldo/keto reductase, partial [Anaerolineales bacterium]|nr:aldo/keto reductase [Anaerolineales bacterium]